MAAGYSEAQLLTNRAAVLLFGSTESERRAWAEESARSFGLPGPTVADTPDRLRAALALSNGVVFIPDVLVMGYELQGALVRCLREREERPKLIVAVQGSVNSAREDGRLRDDLHYALHRGEVNLASSELREAIQARRAKAARARPAEPAKRAEPAAAKKPTKKR